MSGKACRERQRAAKSERHRIALETRAILVERFPKAFMPKGAAKIPLKIGIHRDVIAACPDIPPENVNLAFRDYCRGSTYLRAIQVGAARVDLTGVEASIVTEQHAKSAVGSLKGLQRRFARIEAKRIERAALVKAA